MKWRQYRDITPKEQFVIGADCSQGGADYNAAIFFSRSKLDVPLVYHTRGVAASMTADLHPVIERVFDATGVKPLVALERNNGGASEMERLNVLNRLGKYNLYKMRQVGIADPQETEKLGFTTNAVTRPQMLGDLKNAIDNKLITLYDKPLLSELYSFIVNKMGKPEAERAAHDDLIISLAISWQLYQTAQSTSSIAQVHKVISELPTEDWKQRDFY